MCTINESISNFYSHRLTNLYNVTIQPMPFLLYYCDISTQQQQRKVLKIFSVYVNICYHYYTCIALTISAMSYKVQCADFHFLESNNFQLLHLNLRNRASAIFVLAIIKHNQPNRSLKLQIFINICRYITFRPFLCPYPLYLNEFPERTKQTISHILRNWVSPSGGGYLLQPAKTFPRKIHKFM